MTFCFFRNHDLRYQCISACGGTCRPLEGKTAVVTGASSGIGEAIARHLAAAGARVGLGARRTDRLNALQSSIHSQGGQALVVQTDVTDREQVTTGSI